jgi:hypothetical protein
LQAVIRLAPLIPSYRNPLDFIEPPSLPSFILDKICYQE